MLRKILFWSHLIFGCLAGVVILMMSFTGVVLMYERQILATMERGNFKTSPPSPDTHALPVEDLLAKVSAQRTIPANASVTERSDPREPVEITAGRGDTFYVNPYTGAVMGSASPGLRAFFQSVTSWHRWIGSDGPMRPVARAITGASNLIFLAIVLSGSYLWLPKFWTWKHLRPITWFRGGLSAKARDFNWHNTFGIWALVPLFVVVLTAVPMSYTWANDLVYQLAGSEVPRPGAGAEKGKGKENEVAREKGKGKGKQGSREESVAETQVATADYSGLNLLQQRAEAQVPGWTSIALRLPDAKARAVVFAIDTGDGGQPQKRSTLTVDRASGETRKYETFADASVGRQWRSYSRFLHTGEALGFLGQTVAGLASLAGVMLVWTGISLGLRRFSAWTSRRRKPVEEFAEVASAR